MFADGPLSLHESTIMMNSDSGQSPNKSGSQSVEDPSQNPTEQMNGQINYDELCNIKNLKVVKLVKKPGQYWLKKFVLDECNFQFQFFHK